MVNSEVNQAFYLEGQAMLNSAALLPALVNHGIRLMAYAGNTGMIPWYYQPIYNPDPKLYIRWNV